MVETLHSVRRSVALFFFDQIRQPMTFLIFKKVAKQLNEELQIHVLEITGQRNESFSKSGLWTLQCLCICDITTTLSLFS